MLAPCASLRHLEHCCAWVESANDACQRAVPGIRRFLYAYANLAGDSFRAVDAMLYDRQTATGYVTDVNAAGRDAHAIAKSLGTASCTNWLAAS